MGPITAVTLNGSDHGVVVLALTLGLLVLNFLAVTKIITKAGYSYRWIYVPLTPVVLWCASVILLAVDTTSVPFDGYTVSVPVSLGNFFILEALDFVSLFVTWVFFLIFAFSTWPVSSGRGGPPVPPPGAPGSPFPHRRAVPVAVGAPTERGGGPGPGPGHGAPVPPAAAAAAAAAAPRAPAPPGMAGAPARPAESASDVIYCSWCGNQRARNAQAIHHCGSMERPAAFCMGCGTPLEGGAPSCASCGTAATQLSL
jgi:hypothetical protein